ncbi:cystathionine beta-lyase, putative [Babesia ovata]|uniref:Cystathionine beta-lyase, putative n=1 Tax=Babesia ovata TaxID=189622 RepID=A0A2H6KDH3_9APIC|nr:cystathionine beta-lyase, putative [Babesia ovata]GBE61048.1 cystathionine beta-lyase, putative [Babesia ovata]
MQRIILPPDALYITKSIPEDCHLDMGPPEEHSGAETRGLGNDSVDVQGQTDDMFGTEYSTDGLFSKEGNIDIQEEPTSEEIPRRASESGGYSFDSSTMSFIGFCNLTRGKFRQMGSKLRGSLRSMSRELGLSTSQPSSMELTPKQRRKLQHQSMVFPAKHATSQLANDAVYGVQEDALFGEREVANPKSTKPWLPLRKKDSRQVPARVSEPAIVRNQLPSKRNEVESARKSSIATHKGREINMQDMSGPMPSCYVITKDKDSLCSKFCLDVYTTFKLTLNSGKAYDFKQLIAVNKNVNDIRLEKQKGNAKTQTARGTMIAKQIEPRHKMFPVLARICPPLCRTAKDDTAALNNTTLVTVVNKGSANLFILKFQGYCKNYMDVSPDFGWRRLVEEYTTEDSKSAEDVPNVTCPVDETFAQRTYMYYRESKRITHMIGLSELAINVACRAIILGIADGMIDGADAPSFIKEIIMQQYEGMSEVLNTPRNAEQGPDGQEKFTKSPMYLNSSFIGLFVNSSMRSVLDSEPYVERMRDSKRSVRWSMPENVERKANVGEGVDKDVDEPSVYKFIPIPDYGWRLVQRAYFDRKHADTTRRCSARNSVASKLRSVFRVNTVSGLTPTNIYSNSVLCKVRPPHVEDHNAFVRVDVGSIAMNMAEQLYRLEMRQRRREKLPKQTFGFKVQDQNVVVSPCGTQFKLIPEELILNVATLVHEMYITQACLIL